MTPRTIAVVLAALVSLGVLGWAVRRPGPAAPRSPGASEPRIDPAGSGSEETHERGEAAPPRAESADDGATPSASPGGDAAAIDFLNVRIEEPATLLEEQREADLLRRELEEMGLVDEDAPGE